jgi:hypothetical protein
MSDSGPQLTHTLQHEVEELRAQAALLGPGKIRTNFLRALRSGSLQEGVFAGWIARASAAACWLIGRWRSYRTGDQSIGRNPSRVPTFERGVADRAFEARDLACGSHRFGPFVNSSARAVAMRVSHGRAYTPPAQFYHLD